MTPALLALLHVDASDIQANRAGRLGHRQRRNRRRRDARALGASLALAALLIVGGVRSSAAGGQWLVPELAGAIVLAFSAATVLRMARHADPTVTVLTGPVDLVWNARGRSGTALHLVVAGRRCILPQPLTDAERRWRAALTAPAYRVYVVDAVLRVVGIEPEPTLSRESPD